MEGDYIKKSRKIKQEEYKRKYGNIPIDYNERLSWMVDCYKLSPQKMQEILDVKGNMIHNLFFFECKVVLFEEPEGASRPKFRIINKSNFHKAAIGSQFVHVYVPHAGEDNAYMKKLSDSELIELDYLINTPCICEYNAFLKTPSNYNITETFLSEIGLERPNISKPDYDNIAKKYSDMYNHSVWIDDALVIDGIVRKYYSILPRVEINLKYLNAVYNKKQYNSIIRRKDYDNSPLHYLDEKGMIK